MHLNFCPALPPGLMKYIPPTTTLVKMMPRFLISAPLISRPGHQTAEAGAL